MRKLLHKFTWRKVVILAFTACVLIFYFIYTRPVHFSDLSGSLNTARIQFRLEQYDVSKDVNDPNFEKTTEYVVSDSKTCEQFYVLLSHYTIQKKIPWWKMFGTGHPIGKYQIEVYLSEKNGESLSLLIQDDRNPHGIQVTRYTAKGNDDCAFHVGTWWKTEETELDNLIYNFVMQHKNDKTNTAIQNGR